VVSTNVGGIPYLFEHRKTAMLVEPANPKAMADAVRELLENNALATGLVSRSRRLVLNSAENFVAKKWSEILIGAIFITPFIC